MREYFPDGSDSYYVSAARFCTIGDEWNANDWNAKNNPSGYHALYYRTDESSGRAFLHMLDGTVELLPNKVYFIPAYSVLRSEIYGEIQKYYIHFDGDFSNIGLCRYLLKRSIIPATSYTKQMFDIMVSHFGKDSYASKEKVLCALRIILSDFIDTLFANAQGVIRFQPALRYIEENYNQKITIAELAKTINLTSVYFSNEFSKTFHISPKQYIISRRLFEAKRLLTETDMSISELAEAIGFDNPNYFSEVFSNKLGISPLKYKKHTKKANP